MELIVMRRNINILINIAHITIKAQPRFSKTCLINRVNYNGKSPIKDRQKNDFDREDLNSADQCYRQPKFSYN